MVLVWYLTVASDAQVQGAGAIVVGVCPAALLAQMSLRFKVVAPPVEEDPGSLKGPVLGTSANISPTAVVTAMCTADPCLELVHLPGPGDAL